MKLNLKYPALIALLMCSLLGVSQSARIGEFYDHLPYHQASSICLTENKVFVGADKALFTYDLSDNSLETYSKVNKLSDLGINVLKYSEKHKSVIIGYSNGNIDIVTNNQVINVPDIERTTIQGYKSINNIYILEDFAFLSTGFGIVKLDIQQQEIKETFLIGDNSTNVFVNDLEFFNDTIYAATNEGIYVANENSGNLSNFQNWTQINRNLGQSINAIEANDSILIYNISSEANNEDTIKTYNGAKWDEFNYGEYKNENVYNIESDDDENWLICYKSYGGILNKQHNKFTKFKSYQFGVSMNIAPRQIIKGENNKYWIADNKHGLIKMNTAWNFNVFSPTGPYSDLSWNLDFDGEALWVASGSLTSQLSNRYQKKGVYRYKNNSWESFNKGAYDSISDITSVTVNPQNTNEVYFGAWGKGMIKTLNGEVQEVYNSYNSSIQSLNLFKYHQIGGLAFDENNLLWITCSGSPGANVNYPLVAFDGENWFTYNMNNKLVNNTHAGDIFIDINGYKWFASRDNGIFVFNDNGTLSDTDDDQIELITTGENSGNLPTKMVHAIAEDQDGKIWIGTAEGLTVINNTFGLFDGQVKADRIVIEQEGAYQYLLETEVINCIKVDGGNRKWIGTATGGVYLVSEDGQETIQHFTAENSALLSNTIYDIEIFGTTGEVFFATDKGLISYIGDATDADAYKGPTYAYPNPVRPDYEGLIGIKGLVENSEVKITDITGNIVYETMSEGTTATWDGNSLNGERVQTGVYVVFSVSEDGTQKEVAKILFVN